MIMEFRFPGNARRDRGSRGGGQAAGVGVDGGRVLEEGVAFGV